MTWVKMGGEEGTTVYRVLGSRRFVLSLSGAEISERGRGQSCARLQRTHFKLHLLTSGYPATHHASELCRRIKADGVAGNLRL